ncbi:hypothetical protein Bbelb_042220 [Branchiostoma belcheri]|nr:hypothetical protein Bbelb_042220 [Branchiostoma belcheri]
MRATYTGNIGHGNVCNNRLKLPQPVEARSVSVFKNMCKTHLLTQQKHQSTRRRGPRHENILAARNRMNSLKPITPEGERDRKKMAVLGVDLSLNGNRFSVQTKDVMTHIPVHQISIMTKRSQ